MAGFTITNQAEQVFLLNAIELVVAVFRGPSQAGWQALFEAGLPELKGQVPSRFAHLTAILDNLQDAAPGAPDGLADLETEYVRLFIAASGGVAAPLYESCHLGTAPRVMGQSALAMRQRLADAGLEIHGPANEPPDHLAVELEYLYHLLATAWAQNEGQSEASGLAFAREVMRPWVGRFARALESGRPHPIYAASAGLLLDVLDILDRNPGDIPAHT
ncbi:MAG: molecular chaperone TorD family protein [Pseudodesulfovibrio sp.]|uniref:TorD-like chaperone n=1 Tax=Pseudodesulfovibrio aespoeensis (strain ATCC 700646 / DSM 10631 / Aspo-2) TaxID=643562 RepID=E6VR93_PSEA9|nr:MULTISPECIES: molecular chaperone TorD family protein [Pseudodesulfovibrio]MBU4190775.1 molecular chaperone TorD family protein [Pseudomonadota bacterium]ADU64177.1 TorD-like chaperone [Pseudodesulfovibrio aespoeensis Aspo-2]MBU4245156.1 molecular chaperone TorD family protein [Pseudomonadota bacterium]MBU4378667.1 molecular chaperone TorD family protein [Pseudomonadota bacterium]MBU4474262.1 molecular chaperone TorD family protein [Pseudomonadota bacterium]